MNKNISKIIFSLTVAVLLLPSVTMAFAPLDPNSINAINSYSIDVVNNNYNLATNENSVNVIVGQVIQVFLGLLATIFIILFVLAGYNWMTAAGSKDKVEKAQETIKVAIIGLLIILAAYIVTYFVFLAVPEGVPKTR